MCVISASGAGMRSGCLDRCEPRVAPVFAMRRSCRAAHPSQNAGVGVWGDLARWMQCLSPKAAADRSRPQHNTQGDTHMATLGIIVIVTLMVPVLILAAAYITQ